MESRADRTERIEALRGLMERLCAPELTLAEAIVLRDRLFELLGRGEGAEDAGPPGSSAPVAPPIGQAGGRWPEARPPRASMRTVG